MKSIIHKLIIIVAAFALLLVSCSKDEVKTVLGTGNTPALTASQTALILAAADTAKTAVTLSGTPVTYGIDVVVSYALEIGLASDNFKSPTVISLGSDLKKTYSVLDLNNFATTLGLAPGAVGQIAARLKATVNPNVAPTYSNVVNLAVTPFKLVTPLKYPIIYVPGDYQGWAPDKAKTLVALKADKNYEGYVNISGATLEFKFTSDPDWAHLVYGTAATAGNLTTMQGISNNLKVTTAGYYKLTANLNDSTWTNTLTTWAVIGDATAGAWATDTPLIYDAASDTWKATVPLTSDGTKAIKFRANAAWAINYGDTKGDGVLVQDGTNLMVPSDGTYAITLNLSGGPGSYKYSLKKQ